MLDRRTLRGVADPRAFSYSVGNRVDRLGTFTVGLPFEAGAGPYPVWQNEVGRAYDVRRTGSSWVSGVRLSRYEGSLVGAAVQPAYVDALAAQAIAARLTPTQAAARFTAQGIDIAALRRLVLPRLTPDDRASAVAVLAAGIPLRFTLDASAAYLFEPRTGAAVGLDRVDETLFAAPDVSGLSRLGTLLSTPRYAKDGADQRAPASSAQWWNGLRWQGCSTWCMPRRRPRSPTSSPSGVRGATGSTWCGAPCRLHCS